MAWLDLTWLDMFDVMRAFIVLRYISHFSPSLRNTYGSQCSQLFVLRFACKKDVYHSLANIERNDFCFYPIIRNTTVATTNKKEFNVFSISYSLPFPVCHRTKCLKQVDVMSHYTRSFMYGNNENGREKKKKITRSTTRNAKWIAHYPFLCGWRLCVYCFYAVFIVYLVHVSSENCF